MNKRRPVLLALLALIAAVPLAAQEEDVQGCKDSPVLSRMPKCHIRECEKKDFDAADLRVGPDTEGGYKQQHVEGVKSVITYACDESISLLNIARNAEAALIRAGFQTVYSGKGANEQPHVTSRQGGVWVEIATDINGGVPEYIQTVVQTKKMTETMEATAEALESQIVASGYCSIYGVHFESGKANILADSAVSLEEMAKLLRKNAAWTIQIEGHTDNVGGKDANLKLSQARAEAVRAWLVSHGIESARLVSKGFGDTKPVADNATEQGRAKNRRVDLRKL